MRPLRVLALVLLCGGLAACGSSAGAAPATSAPASDALPTTASEVPSTPAATTPPATEAPTAAPLTAAPSGMVLTGVALQVISAAAGGGSLLTDGKGMAVYTFGQPGHGTVELTTDLTMFPPALAATANPTYGPGVTGGGTRALADGTFQLTYNSQPLYTCTADTVPGVEVCAGIHMHFYVTP